MMEQLSSQTREPLSFRIIVSYRMVVGGTLYIRDNDCLQLELLIRARLGQLCALFLLDMINL